MFGKAFSFSLVVIGLFAGSASASGSVAGKKPNIVFILTDDQGYGDLSCHGNPILKTPNIDRLHAEGVRFTDFHVSPTCAPTRSALLTGRHEFKNGVTHTILERERLTPDAVTLAEVLKSAGYTTGIFGKWHLGDEPDRWPSRRGFDEMFIHGAGGIGQTYAGSCGDAPGNTYFNPAILHNGTFVKTKGYCTDVFFGQALTWIETVKSKQPFFCYIATNAPHAPLDVRPEDEARYKEKVPQPNVAKFFGMIANIDDNVGRLLERLKEWGLESNTLIIFMNDNGGTVGVNVYNAGMRGAKVTPWLGGTRASSLWRWPGTLEPADCARLAAHIDFVPTLIELAGAQLSERAAAQVEGRSLVPLLENPKAAWDDRVLVTHVGRWPKAANIDDYKYAKCSVRTARWHMVCDKDREKQWQLFDVRTDRGEAHDVAHENSQVVNELDAAYDKWWESLPPLLVNENAIGPAVNPFKEIYEKQFEQNALKSLLAHEVLVKGQSLEEVKRFCDARILPMPRDITWSAWQHEAERLRQQVLDEIVFRGAPKSWRESSRRVEWLDTIPAAGYRIKKLRYEALPGLWIPALLYEPDNLNGRVPVVLNVNGHDGKGKAAPYKQIRCINLAKRGMLALNTEWFGMGQLQGNGFEHGRMNQLDLCGTSGLAVFYLAMERALDLLMDHPNADAQRVAMAGLSGGGWQTILFSALDPRVTLSNPVAGYSSYKTRVENFSDLGDSEQTPTDLAMTCDYTHLTTMRAPRPTLLTYNAKDDCCFASAHALPPLLGAARPIFELAGAGSRLRSHVNEDPGTHNFERENREQLYKMVGDHFFADDASYDAREIESHAEVRSAEELNVPLRDGNLDFNLLARQVMADLPRQRGEIKPTRESVSKIARLASYSPKAEKCGESTEGEIEATYWRIRLGDDWTVPVVELRRGTPERMACVTADGGRAAAVEQIEQLLSEKYRVLAFDPFYLGESTLEDRGYLFALLVSSVGARPIGVQVGQIQAVTRWATEQFGQPVATHVAIGPRISLAALISAATGSEIERPQQVMLHDSLGSLRDVVEKSWSVNDYPEMFCFGLLEHCDLDELVELARPCEVIRGNSR